MGETHRDALGNREYKVITENNGKIQGKHPERMQENSQSIQQQNIDPEDLDVRISGGWRDQKDSLVGHMPVWKDEVQHLTGH